MKEKCISALSDEKSRINDDFPKYENLTDNIFAEITDFINEDFDGVTDNKRYRLFLGVYKNIIITAFAEDAPKAYLRAVFKAFKNEDILKYFFNIMQSKSNDFKIITNRLTGEFTSSWQGTIPFDKDRKLNQLLELVDVFM